MHAWPDAAAGSGMLIMGNAMTRRASVPAVDPHALLPEAGALEASWARSRAHGLDPNAPLPDTTLLRADLRDQQEANAKLLTFSRPVIENLFHQIDCPTSTVLLTDRNGLILSAMGDTGFLDRAAQVALAPGAEWSEATMGTNAIGTAIATQRMSRVNGREHFLARNHFLTCVATPILAPDGGIAGVLDISTDTRDQLVHAHALLRTTAEFIEHRLVEHSDRGFIVVHFHNRTELLGTPFEAVAVFDENGCLQASNRATRSLLQLDATTPHASYEQTFSLPWPVLLDRALRSRGELFHLHDHSGTTFIAHTRLLDVPPRTFARAGTTGNMTNGSASPGPRIQTPAFTPILLSGETGTGKRHWAERFHQQHCPLLPFISIDCSGEEVPTTPPTQGVILLTQFDALPLPQQRQWLAACSGQRLIIAATRLPLADDDVTARLALDALADCHGQRIVFAPLRERSDFDDLVHALAHKLAGTSSLEFHPAALRRLRAYRWPGNLTELEARLRLILAFAGPNPTLIHEIDLPEELFDAPQD